MAANKRTVPANTSTQVSNGQVAYGSVPPHGKSCAKSIDGIKSATTLDIINSTFL